MRTYTHARARIIIRTCTYIAAGMSARRLDALHAHMHAALAIARRFAVPCAMRHAPKRRAIASARRAKVIIAPRRRA